LERCEELVLPGTVEVPGIRLRREEGLAVRLLRSGRSWLASQDGIDREAFEDSLRRAARAAPRAPYPRPDLHIEPWPEGAAGEAMLEFPGKVQQAVRDHHLDLEVALELRRHRRWVRTIGTRLSSNTEEESFYSVAAKVAGRPFGTLLHTLGNDAVEEVARGLVRLEQAREAEPPEATSGPLVLGSGATAVLLHEAVAHALEADTLALGGHPEAAIGVQLGSEHLNLFDDPRSAPRSVRRQADDEGFPVLRRCLLRAGKVEQPLCDSAWARHSELLVAGAGRRGDRHLAPGPRSTHLELAPGELTAQDLFGDAEEGLYLPEVERGRLDPLSGELFVLFPYGRRIRNGLPAETVGPCRLRARVSTLLERVVGVGQKVRIAGAGWCAKGGTRLPVWATAPEIRLEGVEVRP
jgi:predicted Zn-dependent protease